MQLDFVAHPELLERTTRGKIDTSREAFDSLGSDRLTLQNKIFGLIAECTMGVTCEEAERLLEMSHQTCSARLNELSRAGLIYRTGETRLNKSGRRAHVYKVRDDNGR